MIPFDPGSPLGPKENKICLLIISLTRMALQILLWLTAQLLQGGCWLVLLYFVYSLTLASVVVELAIGGAEDSNANYDISL